MAISYSSSASGQFVGVSSTRTLSMTTNAGDTRLIAGIFTNSGSGFSATFNGDAMTAVTSHTNGSYTMYVFELRNPDIGTFDITFNWTGNINGDMVAASYQGDATAVAISNFAGASAATVNITAVTGWTVLLSGNKHSSANSMTAGAGSTERSVSSPNTDNMIAGIFDSSAQVQGATSMASSASGATYAGVIVTIPILIATTQLDTITVTDTQNGLIGSSYRDTITTTDAVSSPTWQAKVKSTTGTWTNLPKS